MRKYILGRAIQAIISLFAISIIVFLTVRLTGSPVDIMVSEYTSLEDRARMEKFLGLDKPLYVQYWRFISNAVKGNLGDSTYMKRPVSEVILSRVSATLELGAAAILVSIIIALPCGVYAAVRRGTRLDLLVRLFAVLGQSVPSWWFGLMLILFFGVKLGILPSGGRGGISSYILPACTMGWFVSAGIMRLVRSSMLDVLGREYVKLAKLKGLSEFVVTWKHAFTNALLPVLTFAAVVFVSMLAGSVSTELVFSWPGVGRLVVDAVMWRDFPIVQGVVLFFATMYIMGNFIVDILYAYLNPKIRY